MNYENRSLERIPTDLTRRNPEESTVPMAPLVTPTFEESESEDEDEELDPTVEQYGPLMIFMTCMAAQNISAENTDLPTIEEESEQDIDLEVLNDDELLIKYPEIDQSQIDRSIQGASRYDE